MHTYTTHASIKPGLFNIVGELNTCWWKLVEEWYFLQMWPFRWATFESQWETVMSSTLKSVPWQQPFRAQSCSSSVDASAVSEHPKLAPGQVVYYFIEFNITFKLTCCKSPQNEGDVGMFSTFSSSLWQSNLEEAVFVCEVGFRSSLMEWNLLFAFT